MVTILILIGVYVFLFPSARMQYVVPRFFGEIYLKSFYNRPCIKLDWRFWGDNVSKHDRPSQFSWQAAHSANMLRDFMILKSIIVIEHDDHLFGGAIFDDDPDLAMFRYKKETKIVSHENLDNDYKWQVSNDRFII